MKITYGIILVCVIIYAAFNMVPEWEVDDLYENFGFSGENLFAGKIWTIVTSIFVHGSFMHLISNMLALFFFGRALEEDVPNDRFLVIFIFGGIMGNLVSLFFYSPAEVFVGASGAIFTIMGVAMIKKPFELIFFPAVVPIPLLFVGIVYTLYTVMAFLVGGDPNIAYTAHLAGLGIGALIGFYEVGVKKSLFLIALIIISIIFILPIILTIIGIFDYTGAISSLF